MLWTHLDLNTLNTELRALLSEDEKALASEGGAPPELQLAPTASIFTSVRLHLPPGRLGEADSVLRLLVRNTGSLKAKWSLKYPNEAELQVPHWVDAGELSPEVCKQ